MPTHDYNFPYNVTLALWDLQIQLKAKVRDWDNIGLIQTENKIFIETEERCDTGRNLYYIPVVPLYRMLHHKSYKHAAHLLTSVCAYLYHVADIPYYTQEDSYLYWQYEMLSDWVDEDEESDITEIYKRELKQAKWIGEAIEQKLFNRASLSQLRPRVENFTVRNDFERQCLDVAAEALNLYTQYPTECYCRNVRHTVTTDEDEDNEEAENTLSIDKYVSFFADGSGWLYDSLMEMVNNEFNEYGYTEEPVICKQFNGNKLPDDTLEFENRLFNLIDDLTYILYHY
ncbi:hypothetical protein GCM10023313_05820 [Mucilaginibacter defluvii]|uniref:Uncharacterized protein n=2 Tax=Mucilaginibacter defluvii TaxID=1196019 RepID=A0ABP9FN68_9SPHI